MPRNREFTSRPPPLSSVEDAQLLPETVDGPISFFNPTRARYDVKPSVEDGLEPSAAEPRTQIQWRSRDNRKGRHVLVVEKGAKHKGGPAPTNTFRAILRGLKRMCTECPYWDVSYLVGVFFTVGCAIFIVCGLFYWLPLVAPSSAFKGEEIAGDVTSFIGATLFQFGAILLVFEACNENQTGCFGWELHRVIHGEAEEPVSASDNNIVKSDNVTTTVHVKPYPGSCTHHHPNKFLEQKQSMQQAGRRWEWWPTWKEVKTHYIHEMGWLASMTMAIGATIFYVCGICSLPGIYSNMSEGLAYGLYWMTYLVGGILFIISSVFYVLETQPNWYTPAPHLLGWHIGVWNLIGSVGWTIAAAMGYCKASWCEYQSELSLTWASVAFFIGSALLWYEALSKYPIEEDGKRC